MIDVEAVKMFVAKLRNGEATHTTFMQLTTHQQNLLLSLPLLSEVARMPYYRGPRDELENMIVHCLHVSSQKEVGYDGNNPHCITNL